MKKIAIINLESGNLTSLFNAILRIGYKPEIITQPNDNFDALLLPGQGRFSHVSKKIDENNWRLFLKEWSLSQNKLIGICIGMQILFESSDENPEAKGLGLFKGNLEKLQHQKTPMIGWAKLNSDSDLLNQKYAYFVNSFGVPKSEFTTSTTQYGETFCASVQKGNTFGFQYHPEKSGTFGSEVLKACLL